MSEALHLPFIPAWLDELGLTAAEFRVFCHVCRRRECTSSAATIAKLCKVKRDTVFKALRELERMGLIRRRARLGQSTLIEPVPQTGTPPVPIGGAPPVPQNGTGSPDPSPSGGCLPSPETGHHLSPQTVHKGYPREGNPCEGEEETPPPPSASPEDDLILGHLGKAYPHAPASYGPREQRDLRESMPILREMTEVDWVSLLAWNRAPDRIRGRKCWPRNRGEFLDNSAEALEHIRTWWKTCGSSWWRKQTPSPPKLPPQTPTISFVAPDEPSAPDATQGDQAELATGKDIKQILGSGSYLTGPQDSLKAAQGHEESGRLPKGTSSKIANSLDTIEGSFERRKSAQDKEREAVSA